VAKISFQREKCKKKLCTRTFFTVDASINNNKQYSTVMALGVGTIISAI
jgi:hypothetical protein